MKFAQWDELPDCCKSCRFRDYDSRDEYSPNYNYCMKGLILPTKNKQCAKNNPLQHKEPTMNAFNEHARKQVDNRIKEFMGCDPESIKDQVEEIALEIADDLRNHGVWRDRRGKLWTPEEAGQEWESGLQEAHEQLCGLIIRNPGCLAIAINAAAEGHREILEKMRDIAYAQLGLMCGDLAIEQIHHDMSDV